MVVRDAQARERLAATAARITVGALAGERAVPVVAALGELLPGGLLRGSTIGCRGAAALSSAFLLAAGASEAGMWLGVAGVPCLGVQACREAGVALERLVVVTEPGQAPDQAPDRAPGRSDELWGHVLASLVDGFDVVLFGGGDRVRAATARRVQSRLQSRGAVLLLVGRPGPFSCDVQVTSSATWEGLGAGHGHLRARRLDLAVGGRRIPRPRRGSIWFPAASGAIVAEITVDAVTADEPADVATPAAAALRRTG